MDGATSLFASLCLSCSRYSFALGTSAGLSRLTLGVAVAGGVLTATAFLAFRLFNEDAGSLRFIVRPRSPLFPFLGVLFFIVLRIMSRSLFIEKLSMLETRASSFLLFADELIYLKPCVGGGDGSDSRVGVCLN